MPDFVQVNALGVIVFMQTDSQGKREPFEQVFVPPDYGDVVQMIAAIQVATLRINPTVIYQAPRIQTRQQEQRQPPKILQV
jgi:hypothetical protein